MRVQHFDRIEVRWDKSTLVTNADQSRTIDGFGAHTGPYTYHDEKGQPFVEHVPPSTLFEQASLDSSAGSTVTIRHGPGLVTPDRYREEAHGAWVKSWDAGGGQLGVRVRVSSSEGIAFIADAAAKGDPVELSPVYEVDVVERVAADGSTQLVQEGRRYSGIALLGPNEARGGPTAKLKLDGPECAPAGSRIQIARPRLDSAPTAPLHSATGRSNTMKHYTLKGQGGERRATQTLLDSLSAIKTVASDQIETVSITATGPDGEATELALPLAMWEAMLEGIGAASAPPVEAAELEPELEQVEALDAGEDDEKMDAKIKRAVAVAMDAHDAKRKKTDARDAKVHSDAATILPEIYDYTVHWTQVAVDAIAKVAPELEARARKLAKDAKTDPEAAGMLRQMLAERRLDGAPGTSSLKTRKIPKVQADGLDDPTPPHMRPRGDS